MFKDAEAMWSSVEAEGGNSQKPQPRECGRHAAKAGSYLRVRDTNTPGLHAAGGTTSGK
jgi:hypothetical protein